MRAGRMQAIALDEDEDEAEAEPDQEDDDEEADIAEAAPRVGKRRPISAAEAARRNEPASSASPRIAPPPSAPKPGRRLVRDREPSLPYEEDYEYPPITLLSEPRKQAGTAISPDALEANARLLESVLEDFGVRGEIIHVRPGPVVTLYEFEPAPGIKSSRVIGLADDIARSMSALSARVAVVPGRNVIGIELPNDKRETVYFRELIGSQDFETLQVQAGALPRQDHRRRAGHRRARQDAASARRRHHRLGQVGRHQHHDPVAALPPEAGGVPPDHGRSENAGALRL